MKFLMDEDVASELDRCLQQDGHEAIRVAEVMGFRTDDPDIWDHACHHQFIVITCNRQDFLELAGTAPETGLIILKRRHTRQAECDRLRQLIRFAGEAGLSRNINFA